VDDVYLTGKIIHLAARNVSADCNPRVEGESRVNVAYAEGVVCVRYGVKPRKKMSVMNEACGTLCEHISIIRPALYPTMVHNC